MKHGSESQPVDLTQMSHQELVNYLYDVAFKNYSRLLAQYDKPTREWTGEMILKAASERGWENMRGRYHNMAAGAYMNKMGWDKTDESLWSQARKAVTAHVEETMHDVRVHKTSFAHEGSDVFVAYEDFDPDDPYGWKMKRYR